MATALRPSAARIFPAVRHKPVAHYGAHVVAWPPLVATTIPTPKTVHPYSTHKWNCGNDLHLHGRWRYVHIHHLLGRRRLRVHRIGVVDHGPWLHRSDDASAQGKGSQSCRRGACGCGNLTGVAEFHSFLLVRQTNLDLNDVFIRLNAQDSPQADINTAVTASFTWRLPTHTFT
jgi:hypothetical protein